MFVRLELITSRTVQDLRAAEERKRIIDWLRAPDPSPKHNAAKAKRQPGTCEWLLSRSEFRSWIADGNKFMWLHASPGAGKTILSSAVIEQLYAEPFSENFAILYYYFDFSDASRQTYNGFLLSIVSQLCKQSKTLPPAILQLYRSCNSASPNSQDLLDTLIQLLEHEFCVFLVIDALDECPESVDQSERTQVLESLVIIKSLGLLNLSIFVASRPEPDIAIGLRGAADIDLDVQAALVNEDIRCYILACLSNDPKLKRWSQTVKDEIEGELMKGANGK
jgi:hypothetical protein